LYQLVEVGEDKNACRMLRWGPCRSIFRNFDEAT
jgi:hypothetical protein